MPSHKEGRIDEMHHLRQACVVDRAAVIRRLKTNRPGLRALGLKRVSLFGSLARNDAHAGSDVDLAVELDERAEIDLFRFAAISERVGRMLELPVDLIVEPARNPRMQAQIEKDRVRVY